MTVNHLKTYHNLETDLNWIDLITTINSDKYTFIDSNNGNFIFAWGSEDELCQENFHSNVLLEFEKKHTNQYLFGYLGYDAKSNFYPTEKSNNPDFHDLPESIFYVPKHIVLKKNGTLMYFGTKASFNTFKATILTQYHSPAITRSERLICNTNFNEYKANIESIHQHLQQGNIYEMNYCINFTKVNSNLDVIASFKKLKQNTKAPFSTLFKFNEVNILSASPERFFTKRNHKILSQPIKGTAPRDSNPQKDLHIQNTLVNNQKEISENIMIVDLVRNDLSRIADKRSVTVPELCKLYSFETVHQLISTVQAHIPKSFTFSEVSKHLFPMGSMTGAPKLSAIQIIEEVETFKRNIYSGTIGFIDPINNMDFNVVIRSIIHNSTKLTTSISVGGAITIKSTAQGEYDECLLKLKKIEASIVTH